MYRSLHLSVSGAVAELALNRPGQRNAMSTELMREMIACAAELAARDDIDAVIVSGSGGSFSAGADLKDAGRWESAGASLNRRREVASLGLRMARAWEDLPQITIAAIERYAIGGGLALAVALDWRVAAREAFRLSRAQPSSPRRPARAARSGSAHRRPGPARTRARRRKK